MLVFLLEHEKNKSISSFNYMNQEGVIPSSDYEKLTLRLNVDQKITDWLTLGVNTSMDIFKRK